MRPLQNRVDPFGVLHATAARGTLMGNRGGRFHRPDQTLGHRRWASRQWISCVCEFRGRHRQVWGKSYTELFFLDEATALAAGHRPCFECRRADAKEFQARFGNGRLKAPEMDIRLHAERLGPGRWSQHGVDLVEGVMVAVGNIPHAMRHGQLWQWTFAGYLPAKPGSAALPCRIITPPAICQVLQRGYQPRL